jgi:hypothetical protein
MFLEEIATSVGGLDFVGNSVCQCHLGDFCREGGTLGRPITKRASKPVRRYTPAAHARLSVISMAMFEIGRFVLSPGKTNSFLANRRHSVEDREGRIGERRPVFACPLHALGQYRPQPFGEVKFIPPGAHDLTGGHGRQNGEFERASANTLLLLELDHEVSEVAIGESRMMFDAADLGFLRQQLVEMAAPSGWVLARSVIEHSRPIEHALDPTAHSARRLRLHRPHRRKRLGDKSRIDCLDGQHTDNIIGYT